MDACSEVNSPKLVHQYKTVSRDSLLQTESQINLFLLEARRSLHKVECWISQLLHITTSATRHEPYNVQPGNEFVILDECCLGRLAKLAKRGVLACLKHAISRHKNVTNGQNAHDSAARSHRVITLTPQNNHKKWRSRRRYASYKIPSQPQRWPQSSKFLAQAQGTR